MLPDFGNVEVDLQPVHKAVYLLFLNHPEGIEFKRLAEYRDELRRWYRMTARLMDNEKIEESILHLTNCPYTCVTSIFNIKTCIRVSS